MEYYKFSSPKLVLEFFVREFYFVGKGTLRTQFRDCSPPCRARLPTS